MSGAIALVGSGEYLLPMLEIERALLDSAANRPRRYVQLATAAGKESSERKRYWQDLGAEQARRLDAEPVFVPVFDRQHANDPALAELVRGAGLIYLSGGDPTYLAETLVESAVGKAIIEEWQAGAAIAGCSAGAMALGPTVPQVRQLRRALTPGLGVVPNLHVLPHFDRYFGWMPERVQQFVSSTADGVDTVGIDEETALVWSAESWQVHGNGKVHCLSEQPVRVLAAGELY